MASGLSDEARPTRALRLREVASMKTGRLHPNPRQCGCTQPPTEQKQAADRKRRAVRKAEQLRLPWG